MREKGKALSTTVATLVILGVGCLAESKHSMGLATKTKSLLAVGLPGELKIAQSQDPSPRGPSVAPTKEIRKIREDKFGFSFDIPTNYQTQKRQDNTLTSILYNPADIKLLECGKKNRLRGYGHQTLPVLVTVQPATPETRLIPELSSTTLRLENIRETTIAKQKAFVYIKKSSMTGKTNADSVETTLSANFFTPDKQNLVTISTFN
ncbi:hypothetical protein IQ270_28640 [Microcoleus sp. LEGE 07076]|uniref:hypothetical protein n=1 Tax=Microcoleus sp. LEGE 07076 TaxID=915322 RepID=UPI001880E527|nr:hypothetical protein [Microcoleus sp. LEGE 07076]MBE9188495.1 hypothetical protein [Microcoleus sp. LEGE 07076]